VGEGECVEVCAGVLGDVLVRDSKEPDGPALRFDRATWQSFIDDVKNHRFDLPEEPGTGVASQ
jgi:hypothetical protein